MSFSHTSLNLVSYNCRGWNFGSIAVHDQLLQSCDICFIQEHWLFQGQLNLLNIDSDFLYAAVSGMESSKLLLGRPFGGCAILYKRALSSGISRLDSPSKRFCSILIRDYTMGLQPCLYMFISLSLTGLGSHVISF